MIPDYLIEVAMDAYAEASGQSVSRPWMEAAFNAVAADIWDEAYRRGVDDARIADDLRVDVGLGPDLYAQPARQNPYRASETA